MKLRVGDWVEVRSKEEILSTLDKRGRLEGLPYMPQMFKYCGQKFQVYKRGHKTCDFIYGTWGRSLPDGVHLDIRCDGQAYGGCQNACLLFWKEAWLKRVEGGEQKAVSSKQEAVKPSTALRVGDSERISSIDPSAAGTLDSATSRPLDLLNPGPLNFCTEADVLAGTMPKDSSDEDIYTCQMTDVMNFTRFLPWWDVRQYLEDYTSGNTRLSRLLQGFSYAGYYVVAKRRTVGKPFRWLYEKMYGIPWPRSIGTIPAGHVTPKGTPLNLQPGDVVRIKSHKEILATLNTENKNRGLYFDQELAPYCGKVFRVRNRIEKFLDERTGKLTKLKNEAVVLENVWCGSRYSHCRKFCPRSLYIWWREIWLEKVPKSTRQE